jgi:hypothetical protein
VPSGTRKWPFRWPVVPATHQPAPGDTQGNASRQLAGAVVLGVELRSVASAAEYGGKNCAVSLPTPGHLQQP